MSLLADVLLCKLGFESVVVHLQPVAAAFGVGATTCCVVNMQSDYTSVTCVEDGMLLPWGQLQPSLGADDVSRALQHWLQVTSRIGWLYDSLTSCQLQACCAFGTCAYLRVLLIK